MSKLLILLTVLFLQSCGAIIPLASTAGSVRTEVKFRGLEERVDKLESDIKEKFLNVNKD